MRRQDRQVGHGYFKHQHKKPLFVGGRPTVCCHFNSVQHSIPKICIGFSVFNSAKSNGFIQQTKQVNEFKKHQAFSVIVNFDMLEMNFYVCFYNT